ncbi:uncharacterized protein LOC119690066 [Teleopsis dalmanni]|uniref:uncharacterized protein LOC119661813 n=1 Tax=Teleopsis dalmanni TaxID=139649 RepID=UPI0018CE6FE9|nr:uncharacterized protein LOC119661813 [Teleopsis dalmanni]XP_037927233.1 uncharacterized protein LOC119661813 [Teleopsis dalmanni]XP_037927234.1 uncharacterized protein LOC119661813 [Teleopsis dalmanni]XP_037927235.1 uncharacterized protein LOC119661813 [Teleopsis dalmanni]XP_037927236.1 uncharacterized protein LOC119661813 [Teleopsis dalmanni]XP_037927237.1 uncharacterized protein LOC119661813 [Teleopsis dalmanni]XP_037927238.1 uncharacterized protein LOC119661813 [Teleopsis dalmanni]XP_0
MDRFYVPKKVNRHVYHALQDLTSVQGLNEILSESVLINTVLYHMRNLVPVRGLRFYIKVSIKNMELMNIITRIDKDTLRYNCDPRRKSQILLSQQIDPEPNVIIPKNQKKKRRRRGYRNLCDTYKWKRRQNVCKRKPKEIFFGDDTYHYHMPTKGVQADDPVEPMDIDDVYLSAGYEVNATFNNVGQITPSNVANNPRNKENRRCIRRRKCLLSPYKCTNTQKPPKQKSKKIVYCNCANHHFNTNEPNVEDPIEFMNVNDVNSNVDQERESPQPMDVDYVGSNVDDILQLPCDNIQMRPNNDEGIGAWKYNEFKYCRYKNIINETPYHNDLHAIIHDDTFNNASLRQKRKVNGRKTV